MNPLLQRALCSSAIGFLGLGACRPPGIVKPRAPDMTELVESYDSPTGVFDAEDTADVAAAVAVISELLASTDIAPRLRELLAELIEPVAPSSSGQPAGGNPLRLGLRADGYMEAKRICPGWTLPVQVDPDNGNLNATATFSEKGLDPVAWGSVAACRYRVGQQRVQLSPSSDLDAIRVYWGQGVDRDSLAQRDLVFSLALSAEVDDMALDVDVDFRVLKDGALEYLLQVASGFLVVTANIDGSFAVRSRDASLACTSDFDCGVRAADDN
jgi:hypothetical protein